MLAAIFGFLPPDDERLRASVLAIADPAAGLSDILRSGQAIGPRQGALALVAGTEHMPGATAVAQAAWDWTMGQSRRASRALRRLRSRVHDASHARWRPI